MPHAGGNVLGLGFGGGFDGPFIDEGFGGGEITAGPFGVPNIDEGIFNLPDERITAGPFTPGGGARTDAVPFGGPGSNTRTDLQGTGGFFRTENKRLEQAEEAREERNKKILEK